jgi:GT2 family glycosyltransferase
VKIPRISIVILNYNAGEFLEKCIRSIEKSYQQDGKKADYRIDSVVITDNGSSDHSTNFLKKRSGQKIKTVLIENNANLGFSAGNNKGVDTAIKNSPDYVLFLNPDTKIYPGVLASCVNFLRLNPKAGVVTPKLIMANGQMDESCHRGFPTPWRSFCYFSGLGKIFSKSRLFSGYTLGYLLDQKSAHQIDSCTGAFLLIRTKIGEKLNWWDEDFFWYGEDLDFCYRVKQNGWQIFFLPQSRIIHYRGISSGIKKHSQNSSKAKKETRLKAARASVGAMRIFYHKHYRKKYPFVIRFLVDTGINLLEKYRLYKVNFEYR